jgi:hypothetical protein
MEETKCCVKVEVFDEILSHCIVQAKFNWNVPEVLVNVLTAGNSSIPGS